MENEQQLTPLMKQYFDVKERHKDKILFFRLGDFYEMFADDAKIASEVLNITLTARNNVPMCGIPYHSANNYIPKLLNAGHKIALCEQLEKPNQTQKIVKRNVIRVITPGTIVEENLLDERDNNYLMCIIPNNFYKKENFSSISIVSIDVSTGDIYSTFLDFCNSNVYILESQLKSEISKYSPKEILVNKNFPIKNKSLFQIIKNSGICISFLGDDEIFYDEKSFLDNNKDDKFQDFFKFLKEEISESIFENIKFSVFSSLSYIKNNYSQVLPSLKKIKFYNNQEFLILPENTIKHLELTENFYNKTRKYSLLDVLDETKTKMGARLLKKWILEPLLDIQKIKARQDFVHFFYENHNLTKDFRDILKRFNDVERILNRINCDINVPRDLIALKIFLKSLPEILILFKSKLDFYIKSKKIEKNCIKEKNNDFLFADFSSEDLNKKTQNSESIFLEKVNDLFEVFSMEELKNLFDLIDNIIVEDPSNNLKDGNIIKQGINEDLDNLRNIKKNGRSIILDYEAEEKLRTQIPTLKIKFNNIFGYFFEITKLYNKSIPDDFVRVQTLANCERFTTEKLKKYEIDLLEAENKALDLEIEIYNSLRNKIKNSFREIQTAIYILTELDIFANFAILALERNYVKPEISEKYDIVIKNGRHPVVEYISKDIAFVPNDTNFLENKCHFYLITGPNMAGKSTYIRQTALLVIMAQMGSFIPAEQANIGLVDKVFTRIGSGDKLVKGESTFFVEMKETVEIIKEATDRSLVILDEIGRGTSTFDGISIAWVVSTELINRDWANDFQKTNKKKGPKTLFATHYFELIELVKKFNIVKNLNLLVDEKDGHVEFLHKVIEGNCKKSYGIYVAKIAGLPFPLIEKAKQKLKELEKTTNKEYFEKNSNKNDECEDLDNILIEDNIINEIQTLNLEEMSPIYAILKIKEWQDKIKK